VMAQAAQTTVETEAGVHPALERHYTVAEVAKNWGLSERKVRRMFQDAPGVLQSNLRTLRARKRPHVCLRIPESVLIRVHGEMAVRGWK
jgi:AraC-like DNA-binding protein